MGLTHCQREALAVRMKAEASRPISRHLELLGSASTQRHSPQPRATASIEVLAPFKLAEALETDRLLLSASCRQNDDGVLSFSQGQPVTIQSQGQMTQPVRAVQRGFAASSK